MSIPDYQTLMFPVLRRVVQTEQPIRTVISELAEEFGLSEEERTVLLPSGKTPLFASRVHWAATYLVQAGLLTRPRRGVLQITVRGNEVIRENPKKIDNEFLSRFDEFNAFRDRSRTSSDTQAPASTEHGAAVVAATEEQTPEEQLDAAAVELSTALRADLLDRIRTASPTFFEQLIVDLMLAMGYGNRGRGERTGRPNDEGIDGIITEDALGLDTVYLQAKRYGPDSPIGIKDIQAFIGSLVGQGATKGVFVTASRFSTQAREFASKARQHRIILIDGDELTSLLVRYGVGVRTSRTVEIKRLDEDYFGTFE
jgi:restriction system protein